MSDAKISDLLAQLSEDAELLEKYLDDRESVLASSGLSDDQQEILRSRNADRIVEALQAENPDSDIALIFQGKGICLRRPTRCPVRTFYLPTRDQEST